MTTLSSAFFMQRFAESLYRQPVTASNEYHRDKERIVRSPAFFRLRGKTQMLAVDGRNGSRTRFTHTLECADIGCQLLEFLNNRRSDLPATVRNWLPDRALLEAACFAHDLGHPPFGHSGEEALYQLMRDTGGFEGNGQTLRIVGQRDPWNRSVEAIMPTRRLVLAVLKYPAAYSTFDAAKYDRKPPKCYFDEEQEIVDWACRGFSNEDAIRLTARDQRDRTLFRSLDCSLMELADDIANGVYDIEEIIACGVVESTEVEHVINVAFDEVGGRIPGSDGRLSARDVTDGLLGGARARKRMVMHLVNAFVMSLSIETQDGFAHPLLAHRASLSETHCCLLMKLRQLTQGLLTKARHVRRMERCGHRLVQRVFEALSAEPKRMVAKWSQDRDIGETPTRRQICDAVADMTDSHVKQLAQCMFDHA